MKDFQDFKESLTVERINEICDKRIEKITEESKNQNFTDSIENFLWNQRSQTIGLIFDFLEEYHKWLNS